MVSVLWVVRYLAVSLILISTVTAEEVITLTVNPTQQFAPGHVMLKVRVPRYFENVVLCFGFESENLARSSCIQWDGINAPLVMWQEYKSLPPGEYQAFAVLYRVPNRVAGQAKAQFRVVEGTPS